ncbi:MAG: hypothetical protein WC162_00480 [Sphaerochaetaceae bacterium]|nr:hypothetical protein [Sphaerochaetaceae bacterium]
MKRNLILFVLISIIFITGCATVNSEQSTNEPDWVSQMPQSATYYYSVASQTGESTSENLSEAQEKANQQIATWLESQVREHLEDYFSENKQILDQDTLDSTMDDLKLEINQIAMKDTTLIDKFISKDSEVWVLACYPVNKLDKSFPIFEQELEKNYIKNQANNS